MGLIKKKQENKSKYSQQIHKAVFNLKNMGYILIDYDLDMTNWKSLLNLILYDIK